MLYEKQYASSNGEREVECIICETTTCTIFVLGFSLGTSQIVWWQYFLVSEKVVRITLTYFPEFQEAWKAGWGRQLRDVIASVIIADFAVKYASTACNITIEFTLFCHIKWNKSWISLDRRFQWNNARIKYIYTFQVDIKAFPSLSFTTHFPERGRSEGALFIQRSESQIGLIINQNNEIYAASYSPLVTLTGNLYTQHFIQFFF